MNPKKRLNPVRLVTLALLALTAVLCLIALVVQMRQDNPYFHRNLLARSTRIPVGRFEGSRRLILGVENYRESTLYTLSSGDAAPRLLARIPAESP